MADFDPFESGAVAVDEPPRQTDFDPFEQGGAIEPIGAGRQALGRFAQGVASGVAGLPEAIAIGGAALARKFGDPLLSKEEESDVAGRPLYKAGRAIRASIAKDFPVDETRPRTFWGDTIPQGAGNLATFFLGGLGGKALRFAGPATTVALGAGTGGAEAYDEAIKAGASDEDAFKVFAINAGLGTTEAIPIGGWLNRLNKASGNKLKRAIIEGSEEAAQEVFQQVGGNLTAQKYYDPDRKIFEGAGEGGAAGFTLGSVMSLVVSAIGGRRARLPSEEEPSAPGRARRALRLPQTPSEQSDQEKLAAQTITIEQPQEDSNAKTRVKAPMAVGEEKQTGLVSTIPAGTSGEIQKPSAVPTQAQPVEAEVASQVTLASVLAMTPAQYFDVSAQWSAESMSEAGGISPQIRAELAAKANPDLKAWQDAQAKASADFAALRAAATADPNMMGNPDFQKQFSGAAQRASFFSEGRAVLDRTKEFDPRTVALSPEPTSGKNAPKETGAALGALTPPVSGNTPAPLPGAPIPVSGEQPPVPTPGVPAFISGGAAPQPAVIEGDIFDGTPTVLTDEGKLISGTDHGDAKNRAEERGYTVSKPLGEVSGWFKNGKNYLAKDYEGKPVPQSVLSERKPEVLADYPDLKPTQPETKPATPAPASAVSPKQPKPPTTLQQLDALVIQHGLETGRLDDLETLHAPKITETSGLGSMGLAAKRKYSEQIKTARERIASDLGIAKDNLETSEGRTELLAKLKERIESTSKLVEVALSDMPEGSDFTVHGEKFTVKDTNEETGIVTLKDGRTLKVNERASVKIDPGSLQAKEATFDPEAENPVVSKGGELGGEIGQTFNLVGEKTKFVEPTKETTAFGDETLSQNDLFQIEQVTKEVDPFKSADAAQKMYGGAAEAAAIVERQLRTLDQNPEFKKQFDKKQRARLTEVLNLLRERATAAPEANIAERAIAGIEDLQKKLRGSGSDVSMGVPKAILDLALEVARLSLKAGNTIYQAIDAAIAKIREQMGDTAFDETVVRAELSRELGEPTEATTGSTVDPATGERIPNAEGDAQVVQIAGIEYNIIAKERLTAEQKAAADTRARDFFGKELNLPGEPDLSYGKQRGAIDTNIVFKVESDGENHDDAGEALLKHLTEQIQSQHQPGGNPAYVSSLVNAINKNFNVGNFNGVFSDGMIQRLMEISVGESSWRGTMLRAVTGINEDMGTVARNAKFFLRRTYENMFGGDLARKVMDRIALNFRERFTGEEIERLYNENPILQELFLKVISRLNVKPSLREVIQEIFATRIDRQDDIVEKFVDTMVNKFSATPSEAVRLKAEFSRTFEQSFATARTKAQEKALAALLPEERKTIGAQTPLWKKLTDLVNSGWFDSAVVVEEYARSKGMIVPTEAELERMRNWSIKEQSLREPTARDIANNGGDAEKAAGRVASATLEARQDLLRKMNTQWSRWTHPLIRSLRDISDPIKRYNTAMAANEWLTANLLLKLGFGTRQIIDVGTQMVLHTPTRAAQYAFEQWSNDRSAGRDANLFHNLSQSITDAYRTRLKVLGDTLASFRRTLAGKGEQKNVEQLLSSIAVFDRALLRADEMKAEGKPAAARFLTLLALTMRFGRQFAAAADIIQGVPAEAQEMAHQIRTGLREQGKPKFQQEFEFNTILGLLTTARAESLSEARQMLEARGLEVSNAAVQRAAWHILREKIYNMAKTAGLPADEWKAQNHYYRNVIGWNEPESQGLGAIGGPGGAVAMTAKIGKELFSKAGVPAFPFVFGNAMGISLNRKLAYTPLGLFPGFFKGSPWFEGERNIRQRKIEAVIGTTIGSTLFTLAALGIWVVLPRKWPDDEKEKAEWTANGWQPGMLIIPVSDTQEMKIGTRVGPMALLSPYLAAGGALHDATVQQAKKQEVLNERAAKLGLTPEKLEGLDAGQWLNVIGSAAWASAAGGRTASGMLGSYTDFGKFSPKKSGASSTSTLIPGLPGYQEVARMAGANINPKLASFWDLLVPLPTSDANRVNMLGDPMRNENDFERIFQVLSGGTAPLPANSEAFKKNKAYTSLFESDFRPPAINPVRGYQFGDELRPMTEPELQRYTTARGKHFSQELQSVDVSGLTPKAAKAIVQSAFYRANAAALNEVGASSPSRSSASAPVISLPADSPLPRSPRASTGRARAAVGRLPVTRVSSGRARSRIRLASMKLPRLSTGRARRGVRTRIGRVTGRARSRVTRSFRPPRTRRPRFAFQMI